MVTLNDAEAARLVPERDFQAAVVAYLQMHGWLVWHDHDSRKNAAGLPDVIAVKPGTGPGQGGRLLMYELKAEKGRHRPEQLEWLRALDTVETFDSGTWRPDSWAEIERIAR